MLENILRKLDPDPTFEEMVSDLRSIIFGYVIVIVGVVIDLWGHKTALAAYQEDGVFVFWHWVLQGGILWVLWRTFILVRKFGLTPITLIFSIAGLLLAGGIGSDLLSHSIFGFEVGAEPNTAPSHIAFLFGMLAVIYAVMRAITKDFAPRTDLPRSAGWMLSGCYVLFGTLFGAFINAGVPLGQMGKVAVNPLPSDPFTVPNLIQVAYMFGPVFLAAMLMAMVTRNRLPTGALFFFLVISAIPETIFTKPFMLLPGLIVSGLVGIFAEVLSTKIDLLSGDWKREVLFVSAVVAALAILELLAARIMFPATWWMRGYSWGGLPLLAPIFAGLAAYLLNGRFTRWQKPGPEPTRMKINEA